MSDLAEENAKLKAQLAELQRQREQERRDYEAKVAAERQSGKQHVDVVVQRTSELDAMKQSVVKLTRQLDEEVTRRDQMVSETLNLERKLQDLTSGEALPSPAGRGKFKPVEEDEQAVRERGSHVSTKLMRVVDQWMRTRDLQQAMLRGASLTDQAFGTLVQALGDCPSLQTLDLSQNLLTMDSCSDVCQLITCSPQLSFISLADNMFSMRSIGYFMTAIMERQNTKKLMPLDLLDLSGNEGLVAAMAAPAPAALTRQVVSALGREQSKLPAGGVELVAQVMRVVWRFLHDTGHPQVRGSSPEEIAYHIVDKVTLRKMETALMKVMLLAADATGEPGLRPVTANLALLTVLDSGLLSVLAPTATAEAHEASGGVAHRSTGLATPKPSAHAAATLHAQRAAAGTPLSRELPMRAEASMMSGASAKLLPRHDTRDPFADLKAAFEPPREKQKIFNLKQIVPRSGMVLMNMLERLLETTEIDAVDVETEQTLLEFACNTGNLGLAKLCYRRGAKLAALTKKGDTAFNIVTRARRYDMMEFLHTYGVKVNSGDHEGTTALHVAAKNDDVDGICRLTEWGADVNIRDYAQRTPIHIAASKGNMKATMLLLELGADMNAKDAKLYTAAAHANFNSHFALFDRLVSLGGRKHGQIKDLPLTSEKKIGGLAVSSGMLKSSSLGRIGKITVAGLPGPIQPSLLTIGKS